MSSPVTATMILVQGDTDNFQPIIELKNTNCSIGRAQNCDVIWGSLQISRKHATMEYMVPKWYIRDTSTNGLSVNGVKLVKGELFPLKDCDIISFIPTGAVRYRFRYQENAPAVRSPQAASCSRQVVSPNNGRSISPQPSTSFGAAASRIPCSSNTPNIIENGRQSVEVINGGSSPSAASDDSNHSESLLSLDPQDDNFFSFSGDEFNIQSPVPSESSSGPSVVKRKHNKDTSDSDSSADFDRKKKRIQTPTYFSSDEDSISHFQTLRTKGKKASSSPPSESLMTEDQIRSCKDVEALKKHLHECMVKLKTTQVKLKATECERDMEREDFHRKQNDVQSVNAAFKEETYKKILELMESELSCAVCNEVFIQATVIDCGHTFCQFCINEWGRKKQECPICRKSFRNKSRHIEMENFISRIFESFNEEIADKRKTSIVEREDQAKKAVEAARAAATENQQRGVNFPIGGFHAFLEYGRNVDFLAELNQINEILGNSRAGRGASSTERRRSARIQHRGADSATNGAAANGGAAAAPPNPAPTRGRANRGRGRAAANAANANEAGAEPAAAPPLFADLSYLRARHNARTAVDAGSGNEDAAAAGAPPLPRYPLPFPTVRRNEPAGGIPIVTLDNSTDGESPMRFLPNQFLNWFQPCKIFHMFSKLSWRVLPNPAAPERRDRVSVPQWRQN